MTSDAKIGLLLGLVFIFIIAFIINGLPKLRGQTDSNELTEIMRTNNPPGIGWEARSDEVINPPRQQTAQEVQRTETVSPPQPQTTSTEDDFRYARPLPPYRSLLAENFNSSQTQTFGPVQQTSEAPIIPQTPVTAHQVEPAKITLPKEPETTRTVTINIPRPPKPETKTYVVVKGDSLGAIAKKMYGAEEGNKRANVAKIFEANKKQLKSPDQIKVGQELVIPSLTPGSSTGNLFSGSLFEKVKSVGQRTTDLSSVAIPVQTRSYTVKDGDSLWTISADLLGNGIRYKEIAKLNKDVLPNEDDVRVGTKLKIPAK